MLVVASLANAQDAADVVNHSNDTTALTRFGQRHAYVWAPLAIFVSALVTMYLANRTIESNREIARNRATFDYLSRLNWDRDYIEKKEIFLDIRASDKKMSSVAQEYEDLKQNPDSKDEHRDRILMRHSAVRIILNEYEAIAVGIFTGTLSEEIVKRNHRQGIIDAVRACEEFIEITRKTAPVKNPAKLYCESQRLVDKWSREQDT